MKSNDELFEQVLKQVTDDVYCNLPCQVEAINGNFVDVKVFINEEEPDQIIYNVPIQRTETQRAYIFLGIKKGDRGTLKFFDRSTEGYLQSDFDYNSDERQHDINDSCFELGFLPDKDSFVYPTNSEIEIGLKNTKFKVSVDDNGNVVFNAVGTTVITCPNINVTGTITVDGDVIASGKSLKSHTHTDSMGGTTSTPN